MPIRCLLRPQARMLLGRWSAALALALNGQALRLAAKYVITVNVKQSCEIPGTTDKGPGVYIRLFGGLLW